MGMAYNAEVQRKWREAHPGYQTEWTRKNKGRYKESQRNRILQKLYGITIEQYNQLFLEQEGKCKICQRHQSEFKRRFAVDHCHTTNKVRGLLCHHCNKALGHFFEDISTMESAILYLKESQH
jgi:hypothetical protein